MSSSATETAARALTRDPDTTAERPNRPLEVFPGSNGDLQRADALRRGVSKSANREGVKGTFWWLLAPLPGPTIVWPWRERFCIQIV